MVETHGVCVLLAPEAGANLVVAYDEREAALWIDHYKWSEYEWTTEDQGELDSLAGAVRAVQSGDAELHFRQEGRNLGFLGGRVGLFPRGTARRDLLIGLGREAG
ncbi:hypothetical protein [Streptomyces alkaliterrae]|uniref:Uncharacterized protein n=2 Tax=Streptomyces alkaliterrae TaxID=2213162 RepID=A0A5P0YRI3_9ACTN|nr:hypothetical protein [Streptomyces alkaliterrae]MQS02052.1 hypothetical protein [Streptomyces alkaliterrae]